MSQIKDENSTSTESGSRSILSQNSNKYDKNDLDNFEKQETTQAEMPKKPASAYIVSSILCLMIAFGGYVYGWDTGTIGGFLNHIDFQKRFGQQHDDGTYYFSNARTGLIVSIFNIGCAIGGIAWSRIGDIWGRRLALVWVTIVYMVGLVISITATDKWYQYFIGRIISGVGVGGIAVYSPLMISEVSPKHLRGTLVSCYQLMITLGIFLGYCANYGTEHSYKDSRQWRIPLGLGFAWGLFMIAAMLFVPESPRFLIEVGRMEDARISVGRSNKLPADDPTVIAEVEFLAAGIEAERAVGNATWGELFSTKGKVLQRTIMGVMIQTLQQLTGANYFFYYGTQIFASVGLPDSYETAIIIGIVNFASTFPAFYVVDKFGRRTGLLWGAAGMICCFVIFASVGVTSLYPNGKDQPSSKGAGNCMIVFTCFFIFCFATTWAPTAYVIVSESFPLRVKAKGMALSIAANWIWNFLLGFFTPFITGAINFYYGYVFMGCLCFAWVYVFFFVPETKGLSLEDVNIMWEEGVLPWKSSRWVPPTKRDESYDVEAMANDDKPLYKRMLGK